MPVSLVFFQQGTVKNSKKSMKIVNFNEVFKLSVANVNITSQDLTLTPENTLLEKPPGGGFKFTPSLFRVKLNARFFHARF